jgi:hypothetical protein
MLVAKQCKPIDSVYCCLVHVTKAATMDLPASIITVLQGEQ